MSVIVQKYGGSSVATPDKLKRVAELVVARKRGGARLVVVVSAMGDTTDDLLALAKRITLSPPRRELDMLVSCGERISMALLSMAIAELGEEALSFTGSQSGIITDATHFSAKIVEVRPQRLVQALERDKIVIVAGYQGMSVDREITTLGRGGSDTSAVALAAALDAEACEIYSDVDGVFSADPRVVPDASRIPTLSYREMEAFAGAGAKVLNADAVAFAREAGIAIHAKKTGDPGQGTLVTADARSDRAIAGVAIKPCVLLVRGAIESVWPKLHGARVEGLSIDAGSASFWIDLENCTDPNSLRAALDAAKLSCATADVVSLVGDGVAAATTIVQRALAQVHQPLRVAVEPHKIAVCVNQGGGKNVARDWHREFLGNTAK